MTSVEVTKHALGRAAERFGWKMTEAIANVTRLYRESVYVGIAHNGKRVFRCAEAEMVADYDEMRDLVRIVSIVPSGARPFGVVRRELDRTDTDAWTDWVERNPPDRKGG